MLTNRELQLLMLVALGYSAKEVAYRCGIAFRTVETHLDTIRLKLRAQSNAHGRNRYPAWPSICRSVQSGVGLYEAA